MQRHGSRILFSATDLTRFADCQHLSWLDRLNLDEPMDKAEDDEQAKLIQAKGIEHEKAYLESLRSAGRNVVDIPDDDTLEARVAQTSVALREWRGSHLSSHAAARQPGRPRRLPDPNRRARRGRSARLRGGRHKARASRPTEVHAAAGALLGTARRRPGRGTRARAPRARRSVGAQFPAARLPALLPPLAWTVRSLCRRAPRNDSREVRLLRPLRLAQPLRRRVGGRRPPESGREHHEGPDQASSPERCRHRRAAREVAWTRDLARRAARDARKASRAGGAAVEEACDRRGSAGSPAA